MEFRTLGRTGLSVSLVSFGTGGPSGFGAPEAAERPQRAELVHRCLEHGINLFDTSENYGDSEALLGEALAGVPRDRYLLLTKWAPSPRWSPAGMGGADAPIQTDPEALTRGVEGSLRRLRTDVIDIMELHGVRPEQYEEVAERFIPVLDRLRRDGKIRHRGISERYIVDPRHEAVSLALERHPDSWDVISLKYGILNQFAAKRALPLARRHGAGVVCMSAVRSKLSQQPQLRALIAELKRGRGDRRGRAGRRRPPGMAGWRQRRLGDHSRLPLRRAPSRHPHGADRDHQPPAPRRQRRLHGDPRAPRGARRAPAVRVRRSGRLGLIGRRLRRYTACR